MTPEEIKQRHDQSIADYPDVHMTDNEFVIAEVHRHWIGLLAPFVSCILLIAIAIAFLFNYSALASTLQLTGALANTGTMVLPVLLIVAVALLVMYVAYYIYSRNFFILTNECIIENMQYSLLSHREQTISLGSIEDASFEQAGVLQYAMNYGSIRLSTVGDENTYRFSFVSDPKNQLIVLNDAVENFKNNRPVA
jgi:uncharacterized membrane protein YdbT with pleckstrin-like domain